MNQQQKKAFTLVELIVVITILAILWTIAFISLQWYSADSRDSVRISDVWNMKTSLELFHLDAGKYPMPDNADEVTFSWWVLWYQGTFWEQVRKNVSRNMAEVPTDPLMDKEYTYSVLNNRNELQILTLLEWDISAMNDAQVYAGNLEVTPRVDGNYNGLYVKTSSYIVPTPSILTAEDTTGGMVLDGTNIVSQITHLWVNVPVIWNAKSNTWALSGLKLSVYTGSITSESTDEQKVALMDALIWAYSWSSLDNSWLIKTVISQTGTWAITSMIDSVVLGDSTNVWTTSTSSSSSSSSSTSTSWWATCNAWETDVSWTCHDPYWDKVILLTHLNGVDAGTTFSDEKSVSYTLNGTPTTSTAQSKFGWSSLYLNGSSTLSTTATYNYSSSDFTAEGWFYKESAWTTYNGLFWTNNSSALTLYMSSDTFRYAPQNQSSTAIASISGLNADTWYHIAYEREWNTCTVYVDGQSQWSTTCSNTFWAWIIVFGWDKTTVGYFDGYIDDARVTIWQARYGGNFTPPTQELAETWPFASCTAAGEIYAASSTYTGCDTADMEVCTWAWQWYTIASCNVWTTVSGTWASSYGQKFQWGRNKWFDPSDTPGQSTPIDGSVWLNAGTDTYGFIAWATLPANYTWATTDISDNWWATTATDIARQWPCASWYHVPTKTEFTNAVYYQDTAWKNDVTNKLVLPLAWIHQRNVNNITEQWTTWYYMYSEDPGSAWVLQFQATSLLNMAYTRAQATWMFVRCFKN